MTTQARKTDIEAFVGEDRTIQIVITDDDGKTPTVVTGWTFTFEVRDRFTNQVYVDPDVTIDDGSLGKVSTKLTQAETEALGAGNWRYVLWRADAGNRGVLAYGKLELQTP